jgi:hypothetical protein
MKLENGTKNQMLRLALANAIEWELGLIDAYAHCHSEDDEKYKESCRSNIRDFKKIKDSIKV